jgi:DNA-binding NtrC family response regulator
MLGNRPCKTGYSGSPGIRKRGRKIVSGLENQMSPYETAKSLWQRNYLMRALRECNGIQTRAAALIGVHRNMFKRMLNEAGINSKEMKMIVRAKA